MDEAKIQKPKSQPPPPDTGNCGSCRFGLPVIERGEYTGKISCVKRDEIRDKREVCHEFEPLRLTKCLMFDKRRLKIVERYVR